MVNIASMSSRVESSSMEFCQTSRLGAKQDMAVGMSLFSIASKQVVAIVRMAASSAADDDALGGMVFSALVSVDILRWFKSTCRDGSRS